MVLRAAMSSSATEVISKNWSLAEDTAKESAHGHDAVQEYCWQQGGAWMDSYEPDMPSVPGGKAWRQMAADGQILRWHGIHLLKVLGSTTVSTVYLADHSGRPTPGDKTCKVVVKAMDWSGVLGDYQRSLYPRLVKTYETIPPHPNVLSVLRRLVDGQTTFLVMPWCSQGSLWQALSPKGCMAKGMAEGRARQFMSQICAGLHFLQQHDLPHGRLTCDNVLIDEGFNARLSDYAYRPSTSCNCTDDDLHLRYRAPELLKAKAFNAFAADIWSLGIVLYAMLHGRLPYTVQDARNVTHCTTMPPLKLRGSVSHACELMLKRLLTFHAMFRPKLAAVMADPWMLEIPKSATANHPQCYQDQDGGAETGLVTTRGARDAAISTTASTATTTALATIFSPCLHSFATTPGYCRQADDHPGMATRGRGAMRETQAARLPLLHSPVLSPMTAQWQQACLRQLCSECRQKTVNQQQAHRLPYGVLQEHMDSMDMKPRKFDLCGLGNKKMSPRVASMFARYNPCPLTWTSSVTERVNKEAEERRRAQSTHQDVKHVTNQLIDFLRYSERMRAKFIRFYGGTLPPNCKEFPLPPVLISSVGSKPQT